MSDPRCVICGGSDVTLWTLDNQSRAAVTYLCRRDAAPLVIIMDAARDLPPALQRPLSDKREAEPQPVVHQRHRRMARLEPLAWTPPTEPPLVAAVVDEKEKRIKTARKEKQPIRREKRTPAPMEPLFWAPPEEQVPLIPNRETPS